MQARYYPDYTEFKRKCREGNVVPVYRQLMADTLTPVSAFEKIADGPYAFLFESASGPFPGQFALRAVQVLRRPGGDRGAGHSGQFVQGRPFGRVPLLP